MRPAVKVARIADASRHSRMEPEPRVRDEPKERPRAAGIYSPEAEAGSVYLV